MVPPDDSPRTAFPGTERLLRSALADAPLDFPSFERRLSPCSLARCAGTCCAEGASLNAEEALVLEQVAGRRSDFLRGLVPDLPEPAVVADGAVHRTALKARPFRARVPDYPPHFPETACGFLLEDGRCALQCLAESEGRHPWTYKPLACWLHPISVSPGRIALPDEGTDPHPGGFATQTHCGGSEACGRAAREVLAGELDFLGGVLGRDLRTELREGARLHPCAPGDGGAAARAAPSAGAGIG